uniref:Uncharacterized protein n=1 Tax=Quercus lobata TaxID=97700 RepID=A0A7N2M1F3_QUELO
MKEVWVCLKSMIGINLFTNVGQSVFPLRYILWEASVPCESLWGWKKILLMRGLKLIVGNGESIFAWHEDEPLVQQYGNSYRIVYDSNKVLLNVDPRKTVSLLAYGDIILVIKLAVATTAALAKKYGADITVVVIDERQKESLPEHETQLSSIRWHLSEGGFEEFKLLERLGEGNKSTAIIGEVADDLNLDLVVISMEAIHSKHVDANLLAEFIPCPVILLPL